MLKQHGADTLTHVPFDKLQEVPSTMVENIKYESVVPAYNNKFIRGLSYEPTVMEVKREGVHKESNVFKVYQNEVDGTKDFVELSSVNAIYAIVTKGYTYERSSSCMDNTSRVQQSANAGQSRSPMNNLESRVGAL
ncbi:hypothetical protein BJ912DRAFT_1063475 [Pholiota molesta]|nr:hypothetical protein BJ912DRAFT_1063475 [Pholiota molesta]